MKSAPNRIAFLLGAALIALGAPALAQTFPARPMKLIVPFPAGGPSDIIARVLGQAMGVGLGQAVVIENRAGAGGVTGIDSVARSAPDGYTFGLASAGALAISPSLQAMPYVVNRDLRPLTLVVRAPELMAVPASVPAKTLAEFLKMAREKPGSLNYASTGPGSVPNLAAELLKYAAKIDVVHVPYAGAAPAVNDLLPGRTQMMFADIPVLLPHVKAGTLRALGVGSATRVPTLPDVPTLSEQGLPNVEAENWYGLVLPGKTPDAIVARLNAAVLKALNSPEVRDVLLGQGAIPDGGTPEEFAAFIVAQTTKWAEVIRVSGTKLD